MKKEVKIILDVGSCHDGDKEKALILINKAKEEGANAIKFQLFKNIPPNIPLPYRWFNELKQYADICEIEIFASVWDEEGMITLYNAGCKSIKFAYSQNKSPLIEKALKLFETVYISGDIWTNFPNNNKIVKLYCIPEYPVKYEIDFDGIFPKFDGFSDHTLGLRQMNKAIEAGAKYIEKHFNVDSNCADAKFAIKNL